MLIPVNCRQTILKLSRAITVRATITAENQKYLQQRNGSPDFVLQ